MSLWFILIVGGILTYSIRLSFIFLMGRMEIPIWVKRSLHFVPPAVLSALIVPDLIYQGSKIEITLYNPRLLAGILAILVAWRTRNTLLTIVLGMAALLAMQTLFPIH
jgi:branched-subunit amino acid transport protein